ncbi:hypothetical protein H0H81_007805 [Sphagnurus paluster]|uniref:Uncharacterized protein n=1 Tax=Sphagnurus paluster TaxID=117069 RepID=A0A9P7GND1_9AGAR|nr:hypothetical protein H0H81_007805 [Sphagnurus paluster]
MTKVEVQWLYPPKRIGRLILSLSLSVETVWDASTGNELKELKGHTSLVTSVAFSPDGKHIVSGSDDKSVQVWDAATGNEMKELRGHTSLVISVAFSPDGKHIVSGSHDQSLQVWDASTGKELELKGHTSLVTSVAFSPDGKHIVSGSDDQSLQVWDASIGNELKELKGHTSGVTSVAFSPNGKHIASGSDDQSLQIRGLESLYIRERILDSGQYTGWLLSPDSQVHLMFVPPQAQLPDSSNILTIPHSACSHVDFTGVTLGPQWKACYHAYM